MSKRKRDEAVPTGDSRPVRIRQSPFQERFEHSCSTLAKALKLARNFERQKLSRRQKNAESKPQELARLREEVTAVKGLDLGKTSRDYLIRRLSKAKRIKESAEFERLFVRELEDLEREARGKESAEVTVVARLVNSNPAKEVMPGIMEGVFESLGLEAIAPVGRGKTRKGDKEKSSAGKSHAGDLTAAYATSKKPAEQPAESTIASRTMQTDAPKQSASKQPFNREKPMEVGRLTPVDFGSPSASDHSEESSLAERRVLDDAQRDVSISPSPSLSLSPSPSLSASESSSNDSAGQRPRASTTTFLPSLMGGYISGSDSNSDLSDGMAAANSALPPPRKNRRGQRARRQIFEQNFGMNANHLKNQPPEKSCRRDKGWDVKRGATDGSTGKNYEPRWKREKTRGTAGATGANMETVAPRNKPDRPGKPDKPDKPDKPLHPSWVAAKKQKLQGQKGAFQGTKISFD